MHGHGEEVLGGRPSGEMCSLSCIYIHCLSIWSIKNSHLLQTAAMSNQRKNILCIPCLLIGKLLASFQLLNCLIILLTYRNVLLHKSEKVLLNIKIVFINHLCLLRSGNIGNCTEEFCDNFPQPG